MIVQRDRSVPSSRRPAGAGARPLDAAPPSILVTKITSTKTT